MKLIGKLILTAKATDSEREQMYALLERHYVNSTRNQFEADFAEKDWVIVARRVDDGGICGFSTQKLIRLNVSGTPTAFLYSGDTIIDPLYWSSNPLAGTWGSMALALIEQLHETPFYWFLISKGYKTYRFLPVFFRQYYPRHDRPTPAWATELIRAVATAQFPTRFEPTTGVVRADAAANRLRAEVAPVTAARLSDPQVRFFCERNPGHAQGDELCCLAPLTRENFQRAAYRVIGNRDVGILPT